MSKNGQHKGDQEKDADGKGLILKDGCQSVDAVLHGRALSNVLELEEEAWVADTVAVQAGLEVLSELFEVFCHRLDAALIARVLHDLGILQIIHGGVA